MKTRTNMKHGAYSWPQPRKRCRALLGRDVLEASFLIHGHVCGGMPLGFRAGVAALEALGIEREENMAHRVFVETGTGHAAGCFADGVQMATGCTFGKGLIDRTEYGKWAANLVDIATRRAVRVSVQTRGHGGRPRLAVRPDAAPGRPTHRGAPGRQPAPGGGAHGERGRGLFTVSAVFEYPLGPPASPASTPCAAAPAGSSWPRTRCA